MLHRFWREHRIRSVLIRLLVQHLGAYVVRKKAANSESARDSRRHLHLSSQLCGSARPGWLVHVRAVSDRNSDGVGRL